ncbi:DUF4391 domain-containing protein [Ectothiorhodospira sp. PHS-1]|uniref:DUF4391 domain-containing protein n=1 Tax=Ectothiorhodospira sp. PHS-1 TaxID=519989 RepID=UPI001AEFBDDC|nr:DUF4391 domain-containing protein [Ectothiorhodospira sp. PHS-1]
MFDYPARAAVGRAVPKTRIYAAGQPGRRVRDKIAQQVARIDWQYKLAPETLNLKASRAVPEIQVFTLPLKPGGVTEELPDDILRCIDRAIGFPLIFELTASRADGAARDQVRVAATYKRPNEAEAGKWVMGEYFATDWLPADASRAPLPVALDLARLYEQMLRQLIPLPAREGESIEALADRQRQLAIKQRECRRLETRLHREKQFNRKIELNRQLRKLKAELDTLSKPTPESQRQHD